jgi:release factor glutamine methyltransferase
VKGVNVGGKAQAGGEALPLGGGPSPIRDAHLPGPGEPWTPIRLTRWSGEYLEEKGVEGGRLDAELMLAHVLRLGRLDLYLQFDRPLFPGELDTFKALLKRRASREPLQYILGTVPFRELDLRVDPRALIPRPETEVLVGEVLAWAWECGVGVSPEHEPVEGSGALPKVLTALDIGTGTGAIALSLLKEGPFCSVVATDSSPEALALALENARRSGLEGSLELRGGFLFDPLRSGERFHVLVSNPPYIPEVDWGGLLPEVRDWEPPDALLAGPEGLDVLTPLVKGALGFLIPGGLLALEVGDGQAGRVARAMEGTGGFSEIRVRPDLAGRERVVLGVA